MTSKSKTKNFEVYTYFLNYKTTKTLLNDLNNLARHLKRHKNGLISCLAQAQKNSLIYQALRDYGYADKQIPTFFARPEKEEKPLKTTEPQELQTTERVKFPFINRSYNHVQGYDWNEVKNLTPNRPRTREEYYWDHLDREMEQAQWKGFQEEQEHRMKELEKEKKKRILRELDNVYDPWSAIQVYRKIPKWRAWYDALSPEEEQEVWDVFSAIYVPKLYNLLAQENARAQAEKWNKFYRDWCYGRIFGLW